MVSYSSKKELGIEDNKAIKIKSIDGIFIKHFRKIQNQELKMGKQITIVSGRNGTMKSTLMGLIVHPFQTDEKNIFNKKSLHFHLPSHLHLHHCQVHSS